MPKIVVKWLCLYPLYTVTITTYGICHYYWLLCTTNVLLNSLLVGEYKQSELVKTIILYN